MYMSDISEVYGNNYQQQSSIGRMKYAVKLLGTDIAHKKFNAKHDSSTMWNQANMNPDAVKLLINHV